MNLETIGIIVAAIVGSCIGALLAFNSLVKDAIKRSDLL